MNIPIMHLTAEPQNLATTDQNGCEYCLFLFQAEIAEELERICFICRSDMCSPLVSETRVESGAGISGGLPAFNVNIA